MAKLRRWQLIEHGSEKALVSSGGDGCTADTDLKTELVEALQDFINLSICGTFDRGERDNAWASRVTSRAEAVIAKAKEGGR